MIAIIAITFVAAVVNGALGYGFSSLAVPLALLVVGNRVLNPAIVLLEVVMNAYVLWTNRAALPRTWRRAAFVTLGLPPGIVLGTTALVQVDPAWLKLATFVTLLPLILLQVAGFRRAFRSERAAGIALGGGVGVLYAVTTISGPPLAVFLTNQGFAKQEFRAALGVIRFAASTLTLALYTGTGLVTDASLSLLITMLPAVLVGIPLGALLIRQVREESFRRICMSFDAAIVAFGVSALLRSLDLVAGAAAYLPFAAVMLFNAVMLRRFFRAPTPSVSTCPQPQLP
jgi:uncharacterized membrane protein YfcA